jgi:hypothetical protein
MLLTALNAAEEHVMVWNSRVDLYDDKGKIVKVLNYGKLVQVSQFAKDATRYEVTIDGAKYNARKRFFKSIPEVVNLYKKKVLDLEAEVKKNNLRISNIDSDLVVRYIQSLELERDTSLAYMRITPVINQANNTQQVYRSFSTMLSVGKFKKLKRDWTKEVVKMTDEKSKLQADNRKYVVSISKLKSELSGFKNLGKLFVNAEANIDETLYVIRDGAQLYVKSKVKKVVGLGTVLNGHKHPKFNNWYDVSFEGENYLVSGKSVVEAAGYYKQLEANKITATLLIEQLDKEVAAQQFRLKLYQGVSRQLEADRFIQNGYGLAKNIVIPIDKDHTFTIKKPVADNVYVNSVRAATVLKNWRAEATALAQASLANQKKALDLKKNLVDIDAALKKMKQKLNP